MQCHFTSMPLAVWIYVYVSTVTGWCLSWYTSPPNTLWCVDMLSPYVTEMHKQYMLMWEACRTRALLASAEITVPCCLRAEIEGRKKTLKQWHGKVQPSEISLGCLWTNPRLSSCSQQWDGQKGPLLWFLLVILSVWAGNSMTITFTNYFGSSLTESGSSGTEWKEKDKEETKSKYLMGFFETCKIVW